MHSFSSHFILNRISKNVEVGQHLMRLIDLTIYDVSSHAVLLFVLICFCRCALVFFSVQSLAYFPRRAITMPPERTTGLQPAAIGIDVSLS